MTNTWDIAGKTVVITGASDGIGAVAARKLAAQGAEVAIVGRSADKLARVADEVRAASGKDPLAFTADFTSLDEVRKLATDLLDKLPQLPVTVPNVNDVTGKLPSGGLGASGGQVDDRSADKLLDFLLAP